jgi:hypothetical protein
MLHSLRPRADMSQPPTLATLADPPCGVQDPCFSYLAGSSLGTTDDAIAYAAPLSLLFEQAARSSAESSPQTKLRVCGRNTYLELAPISSAHRGGASACRALLVKEMLIPDS